MSDFSFDLDGKARRLFDTAFRYFTQFQVLDPGSARHGEWISPETGWHEPGHIGQGRLFVLLYLAYLTNLERDRQAHLLYALRGCGSSWLQVRRPSGRIDLRNCNPDSGPDTAFLLQQLLACLELGRRLRPSDTELWGATADAEKFAREAALALIDGGVHTPNHRWVIVSAMAQAGAFWPDLQPQLDPAMRAYMAETPDIDEEGVFIERSVAVYDAVNVASLLFTHEHHPWPAGLAAAGRCLEFDLDLFHPDGTVDTELSRRYDHGTRPAPLGLIACYLTYARVAGSSRHAELAAWMFEKFSPANEMDSVHVMWIVMEFLRGNAFPAAVSRLPDIDRRHAKNGIVRKRKGEASLSLYGGVPRLGSLLFGRVYLHSIMAGQCYMGHGLFVASELHGGDGHYELISRGWPDPPKRLGYAMALGRPVAPDDWTAEYAQRGLREIPACTSSLIVDWDAEANEIRLRYRTTSGLPDVPAQISFDFPAGGIWQTRDCALQPIAGQVLILRNGVGRMTCQSDWIEIEGGCDGHLPWTMRDYPEPRGTVRVSIPLFTPLDHTVTLRWGTGAKPLK